MVKALFGEKTALKTITPISRIHQASEALVKKRLGDISALPDKLVAHIFHIYNEFIGIYLSVLRQKEGKPQDWFPETLSIHPELVDDMQHFFSDYQHITKAFLKLDKQMGELRGIDKNNQPNLFRHKVDGIIGHGQP
jgi:hypothetical protein